MLLTLKERLLLLNILPKEGDLVTQRVVRELQSNLGVKDEEFKELNIQSLPDGRVSWDLTKDTGKNFVIGNKSTEIIGVALTELDKQKKVTTDFLSLYDKFMAEKEGKN